MRTSTRNTLRGTVASLTRGAVNSEVKVTISDEIELVAMITNHSAETLGLQSGTPVFALIKSNFVILAPENEAMKTSLRNRLVGTVAAHNRGAVNDEIVLDLGAGRTLTAIITTRSADELGLGPGMRAAALIDASQIILVLD